MQTIYVAETRDRVKMSDDLDCLPADAIRIETRLFVSNADIFRAGFAYQKRGFDVCIDTASIDCYEFGENELAQTQAIALAHCECQNNGDYCLFCESYHNQRGSASTIAALAVVTLFIIFAVAAMPLINSLGVK